MASITVYLRLAIILIILMIPVSAASAQGPTPTPGNPGGDHTFPLPEIPSIDSLKSKYGIPAADDPNVHKLDFFWDIDNWITFAESSRIGVWFVNNRAWGIMTIILILMIVMAVIRSMSESVYGAGVHGRDEVREYIRGRRN